MSTIADPGEIILVDRQDREVGRATKLEAHQNGGRLHRAFSIFIFNAQGELLLQRRSSTKYHFAGLWTNSCCSHPRGGQSLKECARERLLDEFGFETLLIDVLSFIYRAEDEVTGLTEYELDHVLVGEYSDDPNPNADEIADWRWMSSSLLLQDLNKRPDLYTPWLHILAHRFNPFLPSLRFQGAR
jgi:isopentenyl-diphosphate delta-isomerase